MRNAQGVLEVTEGRIALQLSRDFGYYYRKLIYYNFPELVGSLHLPKFGCHVTVAQPKFHIIDQNIANVYDGLVLDFSYDPTSIRIGGQDKGFIGFYIDIYSNRLLSIYKKVVVKKWGDKYPRLHVTICTNKAENYFLRKKSLDKK